MDIKYYFIIMLVLTAIMVIYVTIYLIMNSRTKKYSIIMRCDKCKNGYVVYKSGLTKQQAEKICEELNYIHGIKIIEE